MAIKLHSELAEEIKQFVQKDFTPHYGEKQEQFESNPLWARLRELGTELWLDTGDIDDAGDNWTREFSAMTTNNTLLNKEVQKGTYDEVIPQAAEMLRKHDLSEREMKLEVAFILNAMHALKLVEQFDAFVSVEEHTDLAHDLDGSVEYARRYHEICPERFYVKIPHTPAGILATRKVASEGIPVNHTLGFGARQNYITARLAAPRFVNVFMGRLNSFVSNNDLGDGELVGERATLASQRAIRKLRRSENIQTRQIGASYREGKQVRDLAGIDVITMPPKVARQFQDLGMSADQVDDKTDATYKPEFKADMTPEKYSINTLWDINESVVECVNALEKENIDAMNDEDLVTFFHEHGCADLMPRWTEQQTQTSAEEGKIPKLDNWERPLDKHDIGLDALMNLAGLNHFANDQKEMDAHVEKILRDSGTYSK
ncbi:MAG: transaldolase family protein [Phycisphaerae bacterium]